jgi:hypothetical protein
MRYGKHQPAQTTASSFERPLHPGIIHCCIHYKQPLPPEPHTIYCQAFRAHGYTIARQGHSLVGIARARAKQCRDIAGVSNETPHRPRTREAVTVSDIQ